MRIKRTALLILLSAILTVFSVGYIVAAEDAPLNIAVEVSASTAVSKDPVIAIKPGDSFDVSIAVTSNPGVAGLTFYVQYDSKAIEPVVDESGKPVYTSGSVFATTANVKIQTQADGTSSVYYNNGWEIGALNSEETGHLITFSFRAKEAFDGNTTLNVQCSKKYVMAADATGNPKATVPVTVEKADRSIAIHNFDAGVVSAPTCTEVGCTTYTCGSCGQTVVTNEVAATGHAYGAPTYTWSDDFTHCTAERVCANDSTHVEREEVQAQVTYEAATCGGPGTKIYTAVFTNPAFETQTKTESVPVMDHAWDVPTYTWNEDHTQCTAKRVCKTDASHVEEETVTASYQVTTAPKCETVGEGSYTTAAFTNAAFVKQIYKEEIPAIGHTYGDLIAEVKATCEATGFAAHYKCSACNKLFDADKVEKTEAELTIAATGHTYGDLIAEVKPTCEATGFAAHYKCSACNKLFDADKVEKTEAELTIAATGHTYGDLIAEVKPTCEATGFAAHYKCSACNKLFDADKAEKTEAELTLAASGHTPVKDEAKAPTLFKTGLTEGSHCSVCEKVLTAQQMVAKKSPVWVILIVVLVVAAGAAATVFVLKKKR